MTTSATGSGHSPAKAGWSGLIGSIRNASPALFWTGCLLLAVSVLTLLLATIDQRSFQGVSVWLKPWKFQFSVGTYLLTLALYMVWLPKAAGQSGFMRVVVWSAVISGMFEVLYIAWQGALGQASHFNIASPFHAAMYGLMGLGAVVLSGASLALGVVIWRSDAYALSAALKKAIVQGLVLSFVLGTVFGAYMSAQPGGHWVGGASTDAGGLPLFHWSRSGGDLRVAHFFGLHALHFVPAFAVLLLTVGMSQRLTSRLVTLFSAVLTLLCIAVFVQALGGLPFLPLTG